MSQLVLGLNVHHGKSAAVLVAEKGPVAAMVEERLNPPPHSSDFPTLAIAEVLRIAGAEASDITSVAVAHDPNSNWLQKAGFLAMHPKHGAKLMGRRFSRQADVRLRLAEALGVETNRNLEVHYVEHQLAHAAAAFYWSHFERATGLSIDGACDFATSMTARCQGTRIEVMKRTYWPHSLGIFCAAVSHFIGFNRYGEEARWMWASTSGKNSYSRLMRELIKFDPSHGVRLNLDYFQHQHIKPSEMTDSGVGTIPRFWSGRLIDELGPPRDRTGELTERERDLAASMQVRYEEVLSDIVHHAVAEAGVRDVAFSGPGTLNAVANARILEHGYAARAYFHPAASDHGAAMGAAHYVMHNQLGVPRCEPVDHSYLGTSFTNEEIASVLHGCPHPTEKLEPRALVRRASEALRQGRLLGWFQGREEWSSQPLGNRSVFGSPAWPGIGPALRARAGASEPFAPPAFVVCSEDLPRCFESKSDVPFSMLALKLKPEWRQRLEPAHHAAGVGQVQTIRREQNPLLYELVSRFKELTGVPLLAKASFVENEPIIHSPEQARACFEDTNMDCLALGAYWIEKALS